MVRATATVARVNSGMLQSAQGLSYAGNGEQCLSKTGRYRLVQQSGNDRITQPGYRECLHAMHALGGFTADHASNI
jgi:hypothetical protein